MNDTLAGLRPGQRDALRIAGATFFAAGALALFLRKDGNDQWAAFPKLLVLAIPCVLLYGLGTGQLRIGRTEEAPDTPDAIPAWRSVALVFGLIFIPLTLLQLIDTLGGDPDKSGHNAWVFAVTAAAGGYAALAHGLRWGALFGGLAAIVSWIAFWDAVVDPSSTAVRWLLLIIGALLVAGAVRLERDARRESAELVTAAGIAGLAAGLVGLYSLLVQLAAGVVASAFGTDSDLGGAQQRQEWDIFLLVLAIALIWYGLRAVWRGPIYVGAITLFAFILSVGYEVTGLFSGEAPSGDLVGWPLLLLLLGGVALGAGLFGGGATRPRPDPPAAPASAPPPASG